MRRTPFAVIATILVVIVCLLAAPVYATDMMKKTPRPTEDPGRHQGDAGKPVSPGNPQRPDVNPAGHRICDKGEPDSCRTPTPDIPVDDPTPTPVPDRDVSTPTSVPDSPDDGYVPEPSTIILLASGLAGLGAYWRKNQRVK